MLRTAAYHRQGDASPKNTHAPHPTPVPINFFSEEPVVCALCAKTGSACPQDAPVSVFLVLWLQAQAAMPSIFHSCWGSEVRSSCWAASPLLTEPASWLLVASLIFCRDIESPLLFRCSCQLDKNSSRPGRGSLKLSNLLYQIGLWA